jgi:hypothetical protein
VLNVAQRHEIDTLFLLAACGRPGRAVIAEQMHDRYFEATGDEAGARACAGKAREAMDCITAGKPLPALPAGLAMLFNPGTRAYLEQILDADPLALAAQTRRARSSSTARPISRSMPSATPKRCSPLSRRATLTRAAKPLSNLPERAIASSCRPARPILSPRIRAR